MKNQLLGLIGCGWLGKPLSQRLLSKGYEQLVTTGSDQSIDFHQGGVSYKQFDLTKDPFWEELKKAQVLIYTIPPLPFLAVKTFFDHFPSEQKIIFTSSTSVYGKQLGVSDEKTPLSKENSQSPLLLETEEYLRARFKNATILRLGGLYGQKRHPVYFLAGKKGLSTGEEFLHLAHQQDCLVAIEKILEKDLWGETINIISDLRVRKKEYYQKLAIKLSLPLPEYTEETEDLNWTCLSNQKSKSLLGINYLDPNEFCKLSD